MYQHWSEKWKNTQNLHDVSDRMYEILGIDQVQLRKNIFCTVSGISDIKFLGSYTTSNEVYDLQFSLYDKHYCMQ